MNKIRDYLTKDVKEFNVKLLVISGILFLFVMGLISYKITINESYALFEDTVTGTKTLTFHYEETGKTFSEEIVNKLKKKATNINDGVYYFDEDGNLDYGDGTVIQLNLKTRVPKGVVSIWNKTPIYVCTNYSNDNYEYDQVTKQVKTRTLPCLTDRYQNLVINGDLSYGDNTNLENFGAYNSEGYISKTSSNYAQLSANDYIPIDPNKKYKVSVDMRASNTTATYYAGLIESDIDKYAVVYQDTSSYANTLTTLTQDLEKNQSEVHLANLSNWVATSSTHTNGLMFWDYKDSTGYEYPEKTFTRNHRHGIYTSSGINKTTNTITLTNPWPYDTVPAGTKVSQPLTGGYNYSLRLGNPITTDWHTYSATITGTLETQNTNNLGFKAGAKYVRLVILSNYNSTANTTTDIKNISIKEVKE